ncbi:autotransporter domain-containing protein, partial [Salmonella enterica]|nr:autotransporter domain-containing protein [Salmonella enterica]
MKQFSKLKIASAVSLALLAGQAQAVVQIQDDVSLSGEEYTEALQWTPGAAGNALVLDNVTVDTAVKGHAGVLAYTAENNNITVRDSAITGGEAGFALRFDSVTGSDILIENTDLSTNGGRSHTYKNKLLSDSTLTLKDSSLTGGTRGVYIENVDKGSVITLDNTHISDTLDHGVIFDGTMNDSTLNITNGSTISSDGNALSLYGVVNTSEMVIAGSALSGNKYGIEVDAMTDSDLSITDGSTISSEGTALYVKQATGGALNVSDSILSGEAYGLYSTVNGSQVNINNAELTGEEKSALYLEATDSSLNIADSTLTGKNYGLQAEVTNSQVTIKDGIFTGETNGIGFWGRDSDIAIAGTQTNSLFMRGTGQTVDIAGSDLGLVNINGQYATPEDTRGNNLVNITASKMKELRIMSGGYLAGRNTINLTDSDITADGVGVAIRIQDSGNNIVNVTNSVVRGTITSATTASWGDERDKPAKNVITLDNSHFEGKILTFISSDPDVLPPGSTINMTNNTTWVAKGESNAETVNITDSTVDLQDAVVKADSWHSENTDVLINSESLLNIGTGSGDMNVVIKSDGKELDILGKEIIRVESGEMAVEAGEVDLGAYKYELKYQDGKWVLVQKGSGESENNTGGETENNTGGEEEKETGSTGGSGAVLSNSANAVLSALAAPQAAWNSQTGAVYERLNSRLPQDEGSVWGTYYGHEWAGEAGLSSTFNQKISGMAIGADKTLALDGGRLTLGAAVMHDQSHLSGFDTRGSGGSMNSTAVHAYGRLDMDNGLFFGGTASAGWSDTKLHATSTDGAVARGDVRQTLTGLTGQAGYRYQLTEEVYV